MAHSPLRSVKELNADSRILLIGHGKSEEDLYEIAVSYGFTNSVTINDFCDQHPLLVPHRNRYKGEWENRGEEHSKEGEQEQPVDAIVVLNEPEDWRAGMQVAVDLISSIDGIVGNEGKPEDWEQKVGFYVCNPDVDYAGEFSIPRFTTGAFRLCVQRLFEEKMGREMQDVIIGKPQSITYDYAEELLMARCAEGESIETVYGIGDNPKSDICGANAAGEHWRSVLVRTGNWQSEEDNDQEHPADVVCDDVLAAVKWILDAHSE
eukprot:TRINITY_DN6321_c0_g1_i1.p1 TRINITY_DN6321_c0_g1~~TRINITY_DN6321_c0_g1_i1.p1  ORF type:complete len:264 (+),score=73.32 TRINITY_DN6321_c0_g1_i1:135-926(+)